MNEKLMHKYAPNHHLQPYPYDLYYHGCLMIVMPSPLIIHTIVNYYDMQCELVLSEQFPINIISESFVRDLDINIQSH